MLSEFEQRRGRQLALYELPDEQREVILLRLEQELTLEEIGAMTGVGRETVKSRLRDAMDKRRARIGDAGGTMDPRTPTSAAHQRSRRAARPVGRASLGDRGCQDEELSEVYEVLTQN